MIYLYQEITDNPSFWFISFSRFVPSANIFLVKSLTHQYISDVFISFYPSFYPHFVHKKVEKPSLPGGEELLSAALRLQGPQLLAQTWPSLVALKDEEVVKAGRVDFKVTKSPIEVA